ncbi:ABC1 kinase family protein [[Mycobacterium] nativiensis]|uniref:AarF/ABC1/UbiB kinase family protein n=1 Tax=[Mycobacterium] nativiensis TaxID=2855503 RepID=A0ABU5XV16_9MYCO|nr:AarF/ABC1/UbiB kinase family protein [Mycolicibacter sp. MYC340]MEB3031829.1 AarF/ABC1/UbiB kinase family protein [Mycolicibacter sp. MYC340]
MSPTASRPVAKLERVPRRFEAARIGMAGWQVARAAARAVRRRPSPKAFKTELLKEMPGAFADLGPTYVKFGQIIASSPGTFGEPLSREFRTLLDAVPPADPGAVRQLLREELGDDPGKLFKHFEETPFASASIAQVHFATLHSGAEVVVKIQRPGIGRRVAADLQILKRLAPVAEFAEAGRRLSVRDVVADFSDNLAEELDFRIEAQSMSDWVDNLHAAQLGGTTIKVPEVYRELTSARVLTMERARGVRIDDIAAIRKQGVDGEELVKALLFATFEGGLRYGLFHGDLHAGNLLVDEQGRVVFLDFGIMGRIDMRIRSLVCELVYALLVTKDHATMGRAVLQLGGVGTVEPDEKTVQVMEAFAAPVTMTAIGDLSYADVGKQFSALADAYDVRLPRELVLIGKQFLYVERYVKLLAPQWQMMADPQFSVYVADFLAELTRTYRSG